MVRAFKKKENGVTAEANPEAEERKRLKKLAFSNNIVSQTPAKAYSQLSPSKTAIKHHGKDILKKSQRKNRFLFSFPGLLAPITGGKIGELKDLGTKNPILYLDFPQGQMKLFGTIVYPQNKYLTLQFSRGGRNAMCEDYFDAMVVFSDAWWIGRKDENPEEAELEFPKELNEGQPVEYDFKGGAGATSENKQGVNKTEVKYLEEHSPKAEIEDDLSDGENNLKDLMKATPVRHSERTAGKKFKFAEASSGDDSAESDADISEGEEKKVVLDIGDEDAAVGSHGQIQESTMSLTNYNKISQFAGVTECEEVSCSNHGSLVQATISTLFKKAEEKKAPRKPRKSPPPKVSSQKLQHTTSKRKIDQVDGCRKKGKVIEERSAEGKEVILGVSSRRWSLERRCLGIEG
ncbi:hypothetical protein L1049_027389 [Liquidambar formosana]|uniref:DNA-binding protein RHL1 n=1 Tax=Liquidambar formosana TaxID=63359 RepID=A0AAP0RIJ5_LIQFO